MNNVNFIVVILAHYEFQIPLIYSLSLSLSLSFSYILSSVCICMSVSLNSVLRMKKLKWQRWHRQQQYFPLDNNLSTWITRRYEMLYIFAFSLRAWWNIPRYRCPLCLQQNLQQENNDYIYKQPDSRNPFNLAGLQIWYLEM